MTWRVGKLVMDKPPIEGLIKHISAFIGDLHVVGHNVAFDNRFLNHDLAGKRLPLIGPDWTIDSAVSDSTSNHDTANAEDKQGLVY